MRVADGDLTARTGVQRNDELGEAAEMFDVMVERLDAVEKERALMLSSISHDLRTPLAALRASVEAIRDGESAREADYLALRAEMENQLRQLETVVRQMDVRSAEQEGLLRLLWRALSRARLQQHQRIAADDL